MVNFNVANKVNLILRDNNNQRLNNGSRNDKNDRRNYQCYGCGKFGHVRKNCYSNQGKFSSNRGRQYSNNSNNSNNDANFIACENDKKVFLRICW